MVPEAPGRYCVCKQEVGMSYHTTSSSQAPPPEGSTVFQKQCMQLESSFQRKPREEPGACPGRGAERSPVEPRPFGGLAYCPMDGPLHPAFTPRTSSSPRTQSHSHSVPSMQLESGSCTVDFSYSQPPTMRPFMPVRVFSPYHVLRGHSC